MFWIRDFKFLDGNPDRRVGVWRLDGAELDRGTRFDARDPPAREGTRLRRYSGHAEDIGPGPINGESEFPSGGGLWKVT